jgi:uncharacterized protein YlxW (UPF0749 family)
MSELEQKLNESQKQRETLDATVQDYKNQVEQVRTSECGALNEKTNEINSLNEKLAQLNNSLAVKISFFFKQL